MYSRAQFEHLRTDTHRSPSHPVTHDLGGGSPQVSGKRPRFAVARRWFARLRRPRPEQLGDPRVDTGP